MAEKLGCSKASFQKQYMMHYRDVRDVLKEELPSLGEGKTASLLLLEGRDGSCLKASLKLPMPCACGSANSRTGTPVPHVSGRNGLKAVYMDRGLLRAVRV